MRRLAILLLVPSACGSAPVKAPTPNAPLSMAADARMITVPGGQYIAGSTPEERLAAYEDYLASSGNDTARQQRWFDREEDRHPTQLATFRIDVMPVTQAEYAEYVLTGAAPAPAIDEAGWTAQHFVQDYATQVARFVWKDNRPPAGREDHPVVLVTHDEAAKYCAWRGRRLPTAEEMEKAARGEGGLAYPWGNVFEQKKLDSAVDGPKDTVAVGTFPQGASPYGVLDLAGNVFEWTSTPAPHGKFIVKGSAWDDFAGVGRGASEHARAPGIRHAIIGFRCAADGP